MIPINLRHAVLHRIAEDLAALRLAADTWAGGCGETDRELVEALSIAHAAALRAKAEADPVRFAGEAS